MDDLLQCYRILELDPGASLEETKRAYRELTRVWHPDRFANDVRLQNKAQEKLKQINLAYEQICGRGRHEPRRPTYSTPPPPRPRTTPPPPPPPPPSAPRKPKPPWFWGRAGPPSYGGFVYLALGIAVLLIIISLSTSINEPIAQSSARPVNRSPYAKPQS